MTETTTSEQTTATGIIEKAQIEYDNITAKAREDALELLKNTRTFIAEVHDDIAKPFQFICATDSRIGDIIDWTLGKAKSCYCCTAIRTTIYSACVFGPLGAAIGWLLHW